MYRGNEGEEEPEWVKNEKEQFSLYRDKDGDGFLNADEVSLICIYICDARKIFQKFLTSLKDP